MVFYEGIAHNLVRIRLMWVNNEKIEDFYSSGNLRWCIFESLVGDMR
ncbi:hypothetical protein CsSME_00043211 [Camellia sinensis var. sinensis]